MIQLLAMAVLGQAQATKGPVMQVWACDPCFVNNVMIGKDGLSKELSSGDSVFLDHSGTVLIDCVKTDLDRIGRVMLSHEGSIKITEVRRDFLGVSQGLGEAEYMVDRQEFGISVDTGLCTISGMGATFSVYKPKHYDNVDIAVYGGSVTITPKGSGLKRMVEAGENLSFRVSPTLGVQYTYSRLTSRDMAERRRAVGVLVIPTQRKSQIR